MYITFSFKHLKTLGDKKQRRFNINIASNQQHEIKSSQADSKDLIEDNSRREMSGKK